MRYSDGNRIQQIRASRMQSAARIASQVRQYSQDGPLSRFVDNFIKDIKDAVGAMRTVFDKTYMVIRIKTMSGVQRKAFYTLHEGYGWTNNLERQNALQMYLDSGGDIDAVPDNTIWKVRPLLHRAVLDGDYQAVEALLAKGADPNLPDKFGYTPIHLLADEMVEQTNERIKLKERSVLNDLISSRYGCDFQDRTRKILDALIKAGADINAKSAILGMTPVQIRALGYNGKEDIWGLKLLASRGADLSAKDNLGSSALDLLEYNEYPVKNPQFAPESGYAVRREMENFIDLAQGNTEYTLPKIEMTEKLTNSIRFPDMSFEMGM